MPALRRTRLLNVPIDNGTLDSALADISGAIRERREHRDAHSGVHPATVQFAFVNADCLNRAWRDDAYASLLSRLPRVYADGSGIRWALRLIHRERLAGNVNGTDLFPLLCRRAEQDGWTLGLVGATSEVMARLVRNLGVTYPGLSVVVAADGFFAERSEDDTIAAIAAAAPDVLLVGMGAPRQERWIDAHLDELNAAVAIGVGGLFDFYSEAVTRAPMLLRRAGMEWAWRLAQEPGRLWRRYLVGNPVFVWRALGNRKRDRLVGAGS